MSDLHIVKINGVHSKILCDSSIAQEISEHFKFRPPNFQYNPKFKAKIWDGWLRLFNLKNRLLYNGLVYELESFAQSRDYSIEYTGDFTTQELSLTEAKEFIKSINLPYDARNYQIDTFAHCVRNKQHLFVSPTASGKSLMIYSIFRYFNKKTLIIVPKIQLVDQMYSDFEEYGYDCESNVHKIYGGQEKETSKTIVVSTWQSLMNLPKEWFLQFDVVFGDEAHKCKATEIKTILENLTNCHIRFGFTGSLDDSKTNKIVLEGLFGPYKKIISTKELMDANYLSKLNLKCIILEYSDEAKQSLSKASYKEEIDWLISNERRNKFITNLALSLKGNTLILFQRVEDHGLVLHRILESKIRDQELYLVHGKIPKDDREEIRKIINKSTNSITSASMGCFAEGINIPNLNNLIIAAPTKSKILIMQSLGRTLRKTETSNVANVFDIADDLRWKSHKNYTLKHYVERIRYYSQEQFSFKQYKVGIK